MSKLLKILIAVAILGVVALGAVYFLFFNKDSPPEFKPSTPAASSTGADAAGTWTVASGSQAGYRVREKLATLPAQSDAVGRTADVAGSITLTKTSLTKADFEVDLTTLESDESRRDNKVQGALQTDQFPKATFTLTAPVDVDTSKSSATVDAVGDLTIHGVTKSVTVPITATLVKDQLELVGKITFPMADYEINPPSIGGFVTVEPDGALEFKILMARSAS